MKRWRVLLCVVLFFGSTAVAQRTKIPEFKTGSAVHVLTVILPGTTAIKLEYGVDIADEQAYEKLSTTELQRRFNSLKDKTLTSEQRLTLVRVARSLWERNPPSDAEKYELVSVIVRQVTPRGLEVTFDSSMAETSNALSTAFLAQLVRPSDVPVQCASRTPVVDLKGGLGLGFFQGAQDKPSLRAGDTYQIIRKFRRAADDAPQSQWLPIYSIAVSAAPQQSVGIKIVNESPPVPITEKGRLLNKDFQWQIQTDKHFHGGLINLTAELLRFDTEDDLHSGKASFREALDLPNASFEVRKMPNRWLHYTKTSLDIGKQLFGLIGAIPTGILAYLGIKTTKRRRKATPQSDLTATARYPANLIRRAIEGRPTVSRPGRSPLAR